jgi:hypothetical protein
LLSRSKAAKQVRHSTLPLDDSDDLADLADLAEAAYRQSNHLTTLSLNINFHFVNGIFRFKKGSSWQTYLID